MKFPWQKGTPVVSESKTDLTIDQLLTRLEAVFRTASGVTVTPENCMKSPTVHAIVTAVAKRIAISPLRVMRKEIIEGRERKTLLPGHPATRLLNRPNWYQTRVSFWLDATSTLMRYGRFYAYKARGQTGPVRFLHPLSSAAVTTLQDDETFELTYRATVKGGRNREFSPDEILHARGMGSSFIDGDSPINECRQAIGLEMALEEHAGAFFANGALPLLVFGVQEGFKGFKNDEDRDAFLDSVKAAFGGRRKFSSFFKPKGISFDKVEIDHAKLQMIESRKYQRSVIAGAFGFPPHMVGDLERATFNNVEQQDTDFQINVVLPVAQIFEATLERDILTDADRRSGVIIRFNLDAIQRADFKSQQEGLKIQREQGIINANDWRERVNMNPMKDPGGEVYIVPRNFGTYEAAEATPGGGDPPPEPEPTE